MEFRVLGPLEVTAHDGSVALGGRKQRAVLVHLLMRANTVVPPERLIDEVWGDEPPAAARNVLQTYVSRLRKALGAGRLERRPGGYVLHAGADEIDARRFETLVRDGRRTATTDPDNAVRLLRDADALWRGPALDDLADQTSLRAEIGRLEELRLAATEERILAELARGRRAELVPELETLTSLHPLRETFWAHLMTALYRSGRQADALAAYRRARDVLVDGFGLEPSNELRLLERRILQQDPELDVAARRLRGLRLLERVGEGSFGVVHRAVQARVGREVAVKVVRPALANDPEFIRRFETEAQLVARLEHPHIVPLYDYWREPDGAFLVMRYLRGGSLRDTLATGRLPAERALQVAGDIAAALAAAHRLGVVHRDVKPANILLDDEGNAYLSDFGIATDVTRARTRRRLRVLSLAGGAARRAAHDPHGRLQPRARAVGDARRQRPVQRHGPHLSRNPRRPGAALRGCGGVRVRARAHGHGRSPASRAPDRPCPQSLQGPATVPRGRRAGLPRPGGARAPAGRSPGGHAPAPARGSVGQRQVLGGARGPRPRRPRRGRARLAALVRGRDGSRGGSARRAHRGADALGSRRCLCRGGARGRAPAGG